MAVLALRRARVVVQLRRHRALELRVRGQRRAEARLGLGLRELALLHLLRRLLVRLRRLAAGHFRVPARLRQRSTSVLVSCFLFASFCRPSFASWSTSILTLLPRYVQLKAHNGFASF